MNIQQQSYEVVARLADMQKMRQMQINTGDFASAAYTLDKMADVFGTGPTAAELRNAVKNAMPRGDLTSGNDHWRGTLAGLGATYDNGSGSDSSVMDMVRRAQRHGPLLEEIVPPALSEYVRPGIIDAAYRYATRVQHAVGTSLGYSIPMSVADNDRKIQEVNNRATLLDFVVRTPNLDNGYTLSGLNGDEPIQITMTPEKFQAGLKPGPLSARAESPGYIHSDTQFWNDANARFWLGFFSYGVPSGVKTPEEMAAQIIANVGNCADTGDCASVVEDTLDDWYGNPIEEWMTGGWEDVLSWTSAFMAPVNLITALTGKPEIRIPGMNVEGNLYCTGVTGKKMKCSSVCTGVLKGRVDNRFGREDYCKRDAQQLNLAYLQRTFDLLGDLRASPGISEGFNDFMKVGAEGAGSKLKFSPMTNLGIATTADRGAGADAVWGGGGGDTGGGAGAGGGSGGGTTSTGIPMWAWIAGGSVLVLGVGAVLLMGGKKE